MAEIITRSDTDNLNYITINHSIGVLKFSLSDDQLKSETVICRGTLNNKNGFNSYLIRRTLKNSANFQNVRNEIDILKMRISWVVDFRSLLIAEEFYYTLMSECGMELKQFMQNYKWDSDMMKRVLSSVGYLIHYLHMHGIVYGNAVMHNQLYVRYGPSPDDLRITITDFWFSEIKSLDVPCEESCVEDAKAFGGLVLFMFTRGKHYIADCPDYDWLELMEEYYDRITAKNLLDKIFLGSDINCKDILSHPALWTDAYTIKLFNRVYAMINLDIEPMVIKDNAHGTVFHNRWDVALGDILGQAAIDLQQVARGVNVYTLGGLISFIRHTVDIHYFNQEEDVMRVLGHPPLGMRKFVGALPKLLIHVYDLVRPQEKDPEIRDEALGEFYKPKSGWSKVNARK